MDRRYFLKISALGSIGFVACGPNSNSTNKTRALNFPITVDDNMKIGHLVRSPEFNPEPIKTVNTETVVVGGGIAGLAAIASLKNKDAVLLELNAYLGGTSGAVEINGEYFAQGAHYDLSYPEYFGNEGLSFLQDTNIIQFNSLKNEYRFSDEQYLIDPNKEEACFTPNGLKESVLAEAHPNTKDFRHLLKQYVGEMKMPTRLINEKWQHLNHISFYDYLQKYLITDADLITGIDYQMIDDYGANCSQISALAGVHYYSCRNYYSTNEPQLFSPPQGNKYFIDKFAAKTNQSALKCKELVFKVTPLSNGQNQVLSYNYEKQTTTAYNCKNVIYAGQKNALKFVLPQAHHLFKNNTYSSWVVLNFELNDAVTTDAKWQNDMLNIHPNLLGFVNSKAQNTKQNVLSVYMCYAPTERKMVSTINENSHEYITAAINYIQQYYNQDIEPLIKSVKIKKMGHAMPIPTVGYLRGNTPLQHQFKNIHFAGTDCGHLPLMFEAMDSGLIAVQAINS